MKNIKSKKGFALASTLAIMVVFFALSGLIFTLDSNGFYGISGYTGYSKNIRCPPIT